MKFPPSQQACRNRFPPEVSEAGRRPRSGILKRPRSSVRAQGGSPGSPGTGRRRSATGGRHQLARSSRSTSSVLCGALHCSRSSLPAVGELMSCSAAVCFGSLSANPASLGHRRSSWCHWCPRKPRAVCIHPNLLVASHDRVQTVLAEIVFIAAPRARAVLALVSKQGSQTSRELLRIVASEP
jgi:hypothetical protein